MQIHHLNRFQTDGHNNSSNRKLSYRREAVRRSVSLDILLSHSRSLKVIRKYTCSGSRERGMMQWTTWSLLEAVWEWRGYHWLQNVAWWTAPLLMASSDLQGCFKINARYKNVSDKPNRIQQQYNTTDDECHAFRRPSRWLSSCLHGRMPLR